MGDFFKKAWPSIKLILAAALGAAAEAARHLVGL